MAHSQKILIRNLIIVLVVIGIVSAGIYLLMSGSDESKPKPSKKTLVSEKVKKPSKPACGDGVCEANENWKNCLKDCKKSLKTYCGDKVCEAKEVGICPEDCPKKEICGDSKCSLNEDCKEDCEFVEPSTEESYCGDKICGSDESCSSCPADCGSCSVPSSSEYAIGLANWGGWSPDQDYFDYLGGIQTDWSRANFLEFTSRIVKNESEAIAFCNSYCNEPLSTGKNCEDLLAGQRYVCDLKVARTSLLENQYPDVRLALSKGFNLVGTLNVDSYRGEELFRSFVRETVDYFGDEIKYWQIGNEVDLVYTGEEYSSRLQMAYEEIKRVCSDCKVGVSYSAHNPLGTSKKGPEDTFEFSETLFTHCEYFDFIDAHLLDLENEKKLRSVRDDVVNWGDLATKNGCEPKELISTETSMSDTDWPLGEKSRDGQGKGIIKLFAVAFDAGYSKVFYRTLFDEPTLGGPDALWAHDGLITKHPENEIKPAFYAFKTLTEKIDGFSSVSRITDTQYRFTVNGADVYILWCDAKDCSLPASIKGEVRVTDYLGNEEEMDTSRITLTESPVFVQ